MPAGRSRKDTAPPPAAPAVQRPGPPPPALDPGRTIRIGTRLTLLSPLAHGGEGTGTNRQVLNRRKFIQPDGVVEEVPVLSGNAVRGQLRDLSNLVLLEMLGNPPLSPSCVHFLFSGGGLKKGADTGTIRVDQARRLRSLLPTVSLFGGGVGNMIMEGKMVVGEALPLCEETRFCLPPEALGGRAAPLASIYEHLEEIGMSRRDDLKRESVRRAARIGEPAAALPPPEADSAPAPTGERPPEDVFAGADVAEEPKAQMRFYVETVAAGTAFWQETTLRDVTDVEYAAFVAGLLALHAAPYLGGKSASGFGRVRIEHPVWAEVVPPARRVAGLFAAPLARPDLAPTYEFRQDSLPDWARRYQEFIQERAPEISAALGEIQ